MSEPGQSSSSQPQPSMPLTPCSISQPRAMASCGSTAVTSESPSKSQTALTHNSTHPGKALAVRLAGPNKAFPISCQQAVPADQMAPTASSQQTDANDSAKPLLDDWQTTTVTESKVTVSNEGSQINTIRHNQTPRNRSQIATLEEGHVVNFSGDQTPLEDCPITSGGHQAVVGGDQAVAGGDQAIAGGDQAVTGGDQAVAWCDQAVAWGDQAVAWGDQAVAWGVQAVAWGAWGQMTTTNVDQSYHGHQQMGLNSDWHVNRGRRRSVSVDQMIFSGCQPLYKSQMTSYISGAQTTPPDGNQMTTPTGHQTFFGGRTMPFNGTQAPYRSQGTTFSHQTVYGNQITPSNANGTLFVGQMTTPTGHQTFFGGRTMPFNGTQAPYRSQGTTFSHQTVYGNQITPSNANGTLFGGQMTTPTGHQSFCGSQMANTSGSLTYYTGQMTTPSGGLTCNTGQMMPLLCSQTPHEDRLQRIPNSHSAQGQPLEEGGCSSSPLVPRTPPEVTEGLGTPAPRPKSSAQKSFLCGYAGCGRAYSKSSHLRAHARKHTEMRSQHVVHIGIERALVQEILPPEPAGEKPYVCPMAGCPWKFSRSDELNRHKKKHTGARPYKCLKCGKNFARSDHLRHHEKRHK